MAAWILQFTVTLSHLSFLFFGVLGDFSTWCKGLSSYAGQRVGHRSNNTSSTSDHDTAMITAGTGSLTRVPRAGGGAFYARWTFHLTYFSHNDLMRLFSHFVGEETGYREVKQLAQYLPSRAGLTARNVNEAPCSGPGPQPIAASALRPECFRPGRKDGATPGDPCTSLLPPPPGATVLTPAARRLRRNFFFRIGAMFIVEKIKSKDRYKKCF